MKQDLATLSHQDLMRLEREIARKHLDKFPWVSVAWGLGNLAVWFSLWPLVLTGALPLWAGFLIATANVTLSYLPSHEAQHDIIARPGAKLRWLNELVGHLSTIPLVIPYKMLKLTHLEHHKHTNDPERDPDYGTKANGPLHAIWKSIQNRQPGGKDGTDKYASVLVEMDTDESKRALLTGILWTAGFYAVLFAMAWSGYALEAALLWWLPRHIGLTYIQYYLSWAPHHPGKETGRYTNTRSFKSILGNVGSLGMQFHIVHHLHPRIPLFRTGPAYWEMKPILEARGANVDEL